jgi:hypothetical protein
VVARWAALPLQVLLGYIADQGQWVPPAGAPGTVANAEYLLCAAFEAQEQSLLWCLLRYSRLVPGQQVERDLGSLISSDQRCMLGQLPVLMMGLGQRLKDMEGRGQLMWAYTAFRHPQVRGSAAAG